MPELPEVQIVVDDLNVAGLPGLTISGAEVFWPGTVDSLPPEEFCRNITGQVIFSVQFHPDRQEIEP